MPVICFLLEIQGYFKTLILTFNILIGLLSIYVTSFSSISYCNISEYWTQKHAQNGNIHSIILDVCAES